MILHRQLQGELARAGLAWDRLPELPAWQKLLGALSDALRAAEKEQFRLERALDIHVREIQAVYADLAWGRDNLNAILSVLEQGLVILDPDGLVVALSPRAEQWLAWPEKQALGQPLASRLGVTAVESGRFRVGELEFHCEPVWREGQVASRFVLLAPPAERAAPPAQQTSELPLRRWLEDQVGPDCLVVIEREVPEVVRGDTDRLLAALREVEPGEWLEVGREPAGLSLRSAARVSRWPADLPPGRSAAALAGLRLGLVGAPTPERRLLEEELSRQGAWLQAADGLPLTCALSLDLLLFLAGEPVPGGLAVPSQVWRASSLEALSEAIWGQVLPAPPTLEEPPERTQRLRVLVAEDEMVSRMVAEEFIISLGHECVTSEDGEQAWEIMQDMEPQVVISDLLMPRLGGLDLCRRVRASSLPQPYFILLTAAGEQAEAAQAAREAGADDFLAKPLDYQQLEQRFQRFQAGRTQPGILREA